MADVQSRDDQHLRAPAEAEPALAQREPAQRESAPEDPGHRGGLIIKERAATRIVEAATLKNPAVLRHSSGLGRVTGREFPKVNVLIDDHAVTVDVQIAVWWPSPIAQVTRSVKAEVTELLELLTGIPVHRVDVTVQAVVAQVPNLDPPSAVPTDSTDVLTRVHRDASGPGPAHVDDAASDSAAAGSHSDQPDTAPTGKQVGSPS